MGRPTGPVRALRSALPLLALALGLLAPGRSAAQGLPPPVPELIPVAAAYTAAWNAHDLPAVLARFAPDAVVRERRGAVPAAVWDTRDPQVVRAYLDGTARRRSDYDTAGLVWVTGHPADRGLGGGALRAAPPPRGGPVPRRRGHGGLAVPGVRRPLPAPAGRRSTRP